jgi:hypothetical protein
MYSSNGGTNWLVLGAGLPEAPVHDLTFHEPTRALLASTHGRSAHLIDLSTLVGVSAGNESLPGTFSLAQNYPNPFNGQTRISYTVAGRQSTVLKVYDLLGREVATLVDEVKAAGTHDVAWNAYGLPSGIYYYRIQAGSYSETKRLVLLR